MPIRQENRVLVCRVIWVNKVEVSSKGPTAACLTTSFTRFALLLGSLPHLFALPRLNGGILPLETGPKDFSPPLSSPERASLI